MSKQAGQMFRKSAGAWGETQLGLAQFSYHRVLNRGGELPPGLLPLASPSIADASSPVGAPTHMKTPVKTILVVERNQLMREGLAAILRLGWPDFEIRFVEDSSRLNRELDCEPTLILVSLRDEQVRPSLAEWGETLHARFSMTPVLLISDQDDPYRALSALRSGFAGYFPSNLSANMLMAAISLVLAGGKFCPSSVIRCGFPEHEVAFGR